MGDSVDPPYSQDHESDDDSQDLADQAKVWTYHLPHCRDTPLRLRPLPATDGVWSPVGADAWYASALLSCMLLSSLSSKQSLEHPFSSLVRDSTCTDKQTKGGTSQQERLQPRSILELGSGAVGLSGLACGLALRHFAPLLFTQQWDVYLTDNDSLVLDQLERNVADHRHVFDNNTTTATQDSLQVRVHVQSLEWDDCTPPKAACGSSTSLLSQWREDEVALVLGSELVYTKETAQACLKILQRLLKDHPNVEIWIVQVTDRFGWMEVIVPALEAAGVLLESIPISMDIHSMAETMIPMGGTLDRYAYGCVRIRNQKVE
eukprot:Nitzschia sp. Nitz4//scaffold130_size63480//15354//16310//NITZ4_006242-RA/size63480-processed-gene-0.77-mRNA-1//1//CDS//3329535168//6951//frame0